MLIKLLSFFVIFFSPSCEGRNPMECRSIDAYLNQPLSPSEEKENNLLKTLQGSPTMLYFEGHSISKH